MVEDGKLFRGRVSHSKKTKIKVLCIHGYNRTLKQTHKIQRCTVREGKSENPQERVKRDRRGREVEKMTMGDKSTCVYPETGRSKGVEECSISHKTESEKDPCTSLVLTISSHSQAPPGSARDTLAVVIQVRL